MLPSNKVDYQGRPVPPKLNNPPSVPVTPPSKLGKILGSTFDFIIVVSFVALCALGAIWLLRHW